MAAADDASHHHGHDSSLDRLSLVSKILLDRRFLEIKSENEKLRQEIEQLKLEVFWYKFSTKNLKKQMRFGNYWNKDSGPRCGCVLCYELGRLDSIQRLDESIQVCKFNPWMAQKVFEECGLTCTHYKIHNSTDENPSGNSQPIFHRYYYDDAHLVVSDDGEWRFVDYGDKLLKATSIECPELKKLAKLFDVLRGTTFYSLSNDEDE